MDGNIVHEPEEEIKEFCSKIFERLKKEHENYDDLIARWAELHAILMETINFNLQQLAENEVSKEDEILDNIQAGSVVVEVKDRNTGLMFRRNLPIDYLETDNGVILSGETLSGSISEIAFLSDVAISRMNDLRGKGPDKSRCGGH